MPEGSAFGRGFKFVAIRLAILLVFGAPVALGAGASGCVTTADCDDVVECPSGQACYDFECKDRCDLAGSSCPSGSTCQPCQQDDPSGQIDHCPEREREALVCLQETP